MKRAEQEVDAFKLIGLLWGTAPAATRSGIGTAGITALAVDIADREGLEAVTLRRVAAAAGVTAMALYPHIGGRAELIELMFDRVAGETYAQAQPAPAPDWRARVEAIARANWATCMRHPWVTELALGRPVPGPGASAKYEAELRALDGIGLADLDMEYTLTALLAFVHGVARAELAARRSRERSGRDDTQWWHRLEPALMAAMGDAGRFPTAARVARTLGEATGKANDPDGAFAFGLALWLEGLAGRLCRPA